MINTETTKATLSEQQTAGRLGINRATLRYYRNRGYLADGLLLPPDENALVPRGRTSALRYDAEMVEAIAAKQQPLFNAAARTPAEPESAQPAAEPDTPEA